MKISKKTLGYSLVGSLVGYGIAVWLTANTCGDANAKELLTQMYEEVGTTITKFDASYKLSSSNPHHSDYPETAMVCSIGAEYEQDGSTDDLTIKYVMFDVDTGFLETETWLGLLVISNPVYKTLRDAAYKT